MNDELTTAMHAEFTVSAQTEVRNRCFGAYRLMAGGTPEAIILHNYELTAVDLRAHVAEWNALARDTEQISLFVCH